MALEYQCPDCGAMVAPVPFIGKISDDQDSIQRKYACDCGTIFLVTQQLGQHTLSDFDSDSITVVSQSSDYDSLDTT